MAMEEKKDNKAFQDFKNKTFHREVKRNFKASNSYSAYSIYKQIRKNKWYDIGRPLTEHEFYLIIRTVNDILAKELLKGHKVTFPYRMGSLELRKASCGARMKNSKLLITYPINWKATLKLWYEDKEARELKTLLRYNTSTVYKVVYDKTTCNYPNKGFFEFSLNRKLKEALYKGITSGEIDTLYERYNKQES